MMRRCGNSAGKHGSRGDVLRNPRLRTDGRALADLDMIDDSNLPGESYILAQLRAARDTSLRRDHRILPNLNVMRDLHQIVDFRAAANHRAAQRRAVDGGVGADLHIVLDDDDADLRDFDSRCAPPRVTETIAADNDPGMENDPLSDAATLAHHHIGMKHGSHTDAHILTQIDTGEKHRALADPRSRTDKNVGKDGRARGDHCACVDCRKRADLRRKLCGRAKKAEDFSEGHVRIGGFEKVLDRAGGLRDHTRTYDHGARSTLGEIFLIPRIGEKRDLPRFGLVDGSDAGDKNIAIPENAPADMSG